MCQNSKTEMCDECFRKLSFTENGNAKGKHYVDWVKSCLTTRGWPVAPTEKIVVSVLATSGFVVFYY